MKNNGKSEIIDTAVNASAGVLEIPLSQLVLGKSQVRTRELEEGISELAANIAKVGVLQPILVRPAKEEPSKFEVVAGQRRFLASQKAGKHTIPARIVTNLHDDEEAKVVSLAENLMRLDPNVKDYIDACTHLFHRYGDVALVAKETGLPVNKVRLFIKYDRLNPELKVLVDERGVDVRTALKVQDAVSGKEYEPEEVATLATKISKLPGAEQSRIAEVIAEQTEKVPVNKLLAEAKARQKVTILVSLLGPTHRLLKSFAESQGFNLDEAGSALIERALALPETKQLVEDAKGQPRAQGKNRKRKSNGNGAAVAA